MTQKIVKICTGRRCSENFSSYIITRLEADKKFYNYNEDVIIEASRCLGRCKEGPIIAFDDEKYDHQNPSKSSEILRKKVEEWKNFFS